MTTKGKLKVFFDNEQDYMKLVEKYEENINFFNDLLKNGHKEDLEFVIPIKIYKYAFSLDRKGLYTKALSVANEVENDLEKLRGQSQWYKVYCEGLLHLKGCCFGRLKKYKESNKYFKELLKKEPTNDKYIEWYQLNKEDQIYDISNSIVIIAMSIAIICIVLKLINIFDLTNTFLTYRMLSIVEALAFLVALFSWVGSYIWKKIINKQKIKF